MDVDAIKVYVNAVKFMEENGHDINHNIMEFVCKCRYNEEYKIKTKKDMFVELNTYFNLTTTGVILQLVAALKRGGDGETYKKYKIYLEALRYGEEKAGV